MKPIGLVTCYFHHNYGSMLQAYATEMIMKKMGLPYETIACRRPRDYMVENKYIYYLKKFLIADWKMWSGKRRIANAMKEHPNFAKNMRIREAKFDDFANTHFHTSALAKNRKELELLAQNYSAFLVGSDQLWRTDSVEHGYYTLEWVPDDIPKIAYSTSIGVKQVPWFQKEKNKRFLNRFSHIALREQSACDLVKSLTGRDVPVVLDPTLLFSGEEWLHIQKTDPIANGDYIFVYLLGDNPAQRMFIKDVQRRMGCKIIALQHLDDYIASDEGFADEIPYDVGPAEFLNYIRNAKYVFTDSFHCTVFSILYKKKFFTFSRFSETAKQSTNTRIDNLLKITGLEKHRMTKNQLIDDVFLIDEDFSHVEERLSRMKIFSMSYLADSFKDFLND